MAKRPALSDSSFLGHVFSPKKRAAPTGLRKTILKGLTGGRKGSRLKSFNRMSATNQEILKRSGQRDAYLKGNTTLAGAKSLLRPQAIALNVAKPLRVRGTISRTGGATPLDRLVGEYLKRTLRGDGIPVNEATVDAEVVWLGDDADAGMLKWGTGQIKYAGRKGSEYEQFDSEGYRHNPFWYH